MVVGTRGVSSDAEQPLLLLEEDDFKEEARSNFVTQQNNHLNNSIRFADAKAGALMAVSGLVLTNTLFVLDSTLKYQQIIYIFGLVCLVVGLVLSFIVVLPKAKNTDVKGLIYWENIQNYDQSEFINKVRNMDTVGYIDAWLINNYIQAQILTKKFQYLAASFKISLIAFALMLLSAVLPNLIRLFGF